MQNTQTNPHDLVKGATREFTDLDHFAEEIRGFGLDWIQLDRGPLRASLRQVAADDCLVTRFRFSRAFHQRGIAPPGGRTFGVTGVESPDVAWSRDSSSRCHLVVFPDGGDFQFLSRPGFHGHTMTVTPGGLRELSSELGFPDLTSRLASGQHFLPASPAAVASLRRALSGLDAATAPRGQTESGRSVVCQLVEALAESHDLAPEAGDSSSREEALRRAIDYINDHADKPPTVQEVSQAIGTSWRVLNYAFRDLLKVSPKQYLQATRLRGLRRDLLAADPTSKVSEVAAGWGFWHMGQLAGDYRRYFAELPSQTLRRVR